MVACEWSCVPSPATPTPVAAQVKSYHVSVTLVDDSVWPGVRLFSAVVRDCAAGVERVVVMDRAGQVRSVAEIRDDASDDECNRFVEGMQSVKIAALHELVVVVADLASAASDFVVGWHATGHRVAILATHPERRERRRTATDVAWAACIYPHLVTQVPADAWDEVVSIGVRQQQLEAEIADGVRRGAALIAVYPGLSVHARAT